MPYRICTLKPYRHRFKHPLQTSHGRWEVRAGILFELMDETGRQVTGEIAPIPWFGSETMAQAIAFCRPLTTGLTRETIFSIPDRLPACQFGLESAWEHLYRKTQGVGDRAISHPRTLLYSQLLPAGATALTAWQPLWKQGYQTFKWKMGVYPIATEMAICEQLIQAMPPLVKLRLDANGGLDLAQAQQWLQTCDCINAAHLNAARIEYLEQPLPPQQFQALLELSQRYATPIALDESVATLQHLQTCYQQGWRSIFVIKPAIVGSPQRLRQFCQSHSIDAVFSTALETTIGRQAGLWLAAELGNRDRAVGYAGNFDQFDYFECPPVEVGNGCL